MKRVLVLAIASAVILPFVARTQTRSDFSGTWALDVARSDPPMGRGGRGGPAGPVTLVITQTPDTLAVETRRGDLTQTATYKLDGSENRNEMMGRGGAQVVVSKAHWDGEKLVIEAAREFQGISIASKEVRTLSPDKKDMTVETALATPQGEVKQKQVFTKS